ncbi:MAG: hypothetical protein MR842_05485 [Clostridiales bacterium]|nr:hypothetical protein [Clostridiales bacterium]MDO4351234.1 hypothetical protein [Eubacteriales bacterium]MDY4008861.1 hypothetical protein [Candidatus Limiplasma sp.]
MIFGRIAVLALSLYGAARYAMRRFRLRMEEAVPFVMVCIAVGLALAGMLNLLKEAALVAYAGGLALAADSLVRRKEPLRAFATPAFWFLLVGGAALAWLLHGARFTEYDDFSHWGLIARTLLENDALPTFRDADISFQNYPPGSACWVYYICRFAGGGEGMMLFAQAALMLACLLPLFGLNRRRHAAGAAAVGGLAAFVFLGGETLVGSLYVDQLLPLVAAAGAALAAAHADETEKAAMLAAPFAIYSYLVKNSGLLFSALLGLLLIGCALRAGRRSGKLRRRQWGAVGMACAAPFCVWYLWNRHTAMVFQNASATKHAMRPGQLMAVFQAKTAEDIELVVGNFVAALPTEAWIPLLCLLLMGLCLGAAALAEKRADKRILAVMAASAAVYLVYQIGMLGMYLFSMPVGEAVHLASLSRYNGTARVLAAYAAAACVQLLLDKPCFTPLSPKGALCACGAALWGALVLWRAGVPNLDALTLRQNYPNTQRAEIQEMIRAHQIPAGRRYVLLGMLDGGMAYNLFQYELRPQMLSLNLEDWQQADAVIIYEPKPLEMVYLEETVLSAQRPPVIYDCRKP